ncbi:MAG: hypothetical protein HZB14_05160 [Actinobacteria bacterium]|nr:hypothetical protein [Actinomycetota bacterium]
MREGSRFRAVAGQASVELVAALPVIAVVLGCAWQAVLAGHSAWALSEAARLAAREYAVKRVALGPEPARSYSRAIVDRVLPSSMRDGRSFRVSRGGAVELRVHIPLAPPFSAVFAHGPTITSRAGFGG